ncbi:MAG: TIGR02710 family CRISPR-associated protein [Nitrospira sp. CR1.3]|nr:TIGR02710 family CRISPR-associated protein [Nitrospira sp. CR1.3]
MAQEQPVHALVVALTEEIGSAVHAINRLRPESLCFVLPERTKSLVERDVQPKLVQMPRRWDWIVLPDEGNFPSCYVTIARTLPRLLNTWGIEPGTLVVDMTGATPAMAGALTLAAMPHASRIVSIVDGGAGREGDAITIDGLEKLWVHINPWDEAAAGMRGEGCALFSGGAYVAAGTLFRQIETRVSGGQKPLYRAFADLADGYDLWERFHYRQAWEKLKASVKAMEMASLFGGPPGVKAILPAIKANSGFLEKLVLDPAEVKEGLAPDLLAHAGRRLRMAHDPEAAMQSLMRALEAFAQHRLFKQYRIKTWDLQPEQLPEALRQTCRTCYLDDVDGKYKLSLQAQFRALAGLGDPSGQSFLKEWPAMKPLLDAASHAVLGHGFEPVKAERVQQLYEIVLRLSGISEASLPKFPALAL